MEHIPDDSRDYLDTTSGKKRGDVPWGNGPFAVAMAAFLGVCLGTFGLRLIMQVLSDRADGYIPYPFAYMVSPIIVTGLGTIITIYAFYQAMRLNTLTSVLKTIAFPALAGLWIGTSLLIADPNQAKKSNRCMGHLKQLGLALRMYESESDQHLLPPLSTQPGQLMFANRGPNNRAIYPDYLIDLSILYCPGAKITPAANEITPDVAFDDHAYFYLGYRITNQDELEAFAQAYRKNIGTNDAFEGAMTFNGTTLRRLSATDCGHRSDDAGEDAPFPLIIERPHAHVLAGSNVLYSDGHVEFIKMNTKWPVNEEAMAVLLALDALGNEPRTASHVE